MTSKTISPIAAALRAAPRQKRLPRAFYAICKTALSKGALLRGSLLSLLHIADPRLVEVPLPCILQACGVSLLPIYMSCRDDFLAGSFEGISSLSLAALLVRLEGFGFAVSPSMVARALRPPLARKKLLTEEERLVYLYPGTRGRGEQRVGRAGKLADKWKTQAGYEVLGRSARSPSGLRVLGPGFLG